jgi:hypothetical protein
LITEIECHPDGTKTVKVDGIPDAVFPDVVCRFEAKYALIADASKPYAWMSFGWLCGEDEVFTRQLGVSKDVKISKKEARRIWNNLMEDGFYVATSC